MDDLDRSDKPASRSVLLLRLLIALAVVAAFVVGCIGVWNWKQAHDLTSARANALAAARKDAVIIASYDYRELDAYFAAVGKISTGEFSKQYGKANTDLRKLIRATKAVVKAKVLNAAIESATEDRVTVLLFVDQTVRNAALSGPAMDRNRARMTLELDDGKWLVSRLELK